MKNVIILLFLVLLFNSCKKEIDQVSIDNNVLASFSYTLVSETDSTKFFKLNNISKGATSFKWYFGTTDSSVAFEPTFKVTKDGSYKVTLIASNNKMTNTKNNIIFVTFKDSINYPVASCKVFYNIDSPNYVRFKNTSNYYKKLTWKFGGSKTSNEINPVYYYSILGRHLITLVAENTKGVKDSMIIDLQLQKSDEFAKPVILLTYLNPATFKIKQDKANQLGSTFTHISYGDNLTENPEEYLQEATHSFNDLLPHNFYLYKKNDIVIAYQKHQTFDGSDAALLFSNITGNYNFKSRVKLNNNSNSSKVDTTFYKDTVLNVSFVNICKLEVRDNKLGHVFTGYLSNKSTTNSYVFWENLNYNPTTKADHYNLITIPKILKTVDVLNYNSEGNLVGASTSKIKYHGIR